MMDLMGLIQTIRGGGNPMQMLMGMSRQNPLIGQAMQMANGRTPSEMRQMVMGMAQRMGVDVGQMAQRMGLRLPW